MKAIYQQALEGKLCSTQSGAKRSIDFLNLTAVPLLVSWADATGKLKLRGKLATKQQLRCDDSYDGYAYVFIAVDSGAFVAACVQDASMVKPVEIDATWLCQPGDIGPLPQPSKGCPIPPDSPSVVVGAGGEFSDQKTAVVRQQYWHLSADSYVLGPREERLVSYQETSGMQQMTSEQKTMAESLGLSASGGWGPISASLTATLSATTSRMQQLTLTTETVRYESTTLKNPTDQPVMNLMWQLTDVVTVYQKLKPVASVVSTLRPVLIAGPYDPTKLAAASSEVQVAVSELSPPRFIEGGSSSRAPGAARSTRASKRRR